MPKVLTAPNEKKCIGCGLCILKSSLIVEGTINPGKSFIRIYGKPKKHFISIDYGKKTSYPELINLCPQNCFELKDI